MRCSKPFKESNEQTQTEAIIIAETKLSGSSNLVSSGGSDSDESILPQTEFRMHAQSYVGLVMGNDFQSMWGKTTTQAESNGLPTVSDKVANAFNSCQRPEDRKQEMKRFYRIWFLAT